MHVNGGQVHKKMINITSYQGNAHQTTIRHHFTTVRTAIIKKITAVHQQMNG